MKTMSQKIRERRNELGLTQAELGQAIGVSGRSIFGYESGQKNPRPSTLLRLAQVLGVSPKYLKDDTIETTENSNKEKYIAQAGRLYGEQGERDLRALLEDNIALFAGGELSQSEKDTFFEAVMRAYITCKDEAKSRFARKSSEDKED